MTLPWALVGEYSSWRRPHCSLEAANVRSRMPEGPEIRLAADRVAKAVVQRPLRKVWFANQELQSSAALLAKSEVQAVRTVGKAMLTEFSCNLTVYSHNQLYGRWYVVSGDKTPRTNRQLRFGMYTQDGAALLYSASDISVWATDKIQEHPFVAKAGIDVLDASPSPEELTAYFKASSFGRRALGGLLLDQGFVAGIGNYLRSEILFEAGLMPERKLASLSPKELHALAAATCLMIQRAYQSKGITTGPQQVQKLKAQGWKRSAYRHYVFARRGAACFRCGAKISQVDVASRRLYFCSGCQQARNQGQAEVLRPPAP